jgi:hypothetical protein
MSQRALQFAALMAQEANHVQGINVVRLHLQDGIIEVLRFRKPPRGMVLVGETKGFCQRDGAHRRPGRRRCMMVGHPATLRALSIRRPPLSTPRTIVASLTSVR